jgi:hypothetical protein
MFGATKFHEYNWLVAFVKLSVIHPQTPDESDRNFRKIIPLSSQNRDSSKKDRISSNNLIICVACCWLWLTKLPIKILVNSIYVICRSCTTVWRLFALLILFLVLQFMKNTPTCCSVTQSQNISDWSTLRMMWTGPTFEWSLLTDDQQSVSLMVSLNCNVCRIWMRLFEWFQSWVRFWKEIELKWSQCFGNSRNWCQSWLMGVKVPCCTGKQNDCESFFQIESDRFCIWKCVIFWLLQ